MTRHRGAAVLMFLALAALPLSGPAAAQDGPSPGPSNALTDVPGLEVGHYNRTGDGYLTGTTVIVAPQGAVGGVDVRGGGPGTRETDLLDPRNLVQEVNAVVLSGGSAYGLDAAHGTMEWLEEQGMGYPVGFAPDEIVPIVPSAILFDLGRGGEFKARPGHEFGYEAAAAASGGEVAQGNVGAGTGAVSGGIKGGIGTASVDLGNGITVAAVVAINSVGQPFNPDTCELYAAYLEMGDEFGDYSAPPQEECQAAGFGEAGSASSLEIEGTQSLNTTIGLVATNLPMTKAQAQKMAGVAHDGMARAIRPVHTMFDGDSVFALSTGEGQITSECMTAAVFPVDAVCTLLLNDVFSAGADAFSRAVAHAILNAETVGDFTSYCDTFPSACGSQDAGVGEPPPSVPDGSEGDDEAAVPPPDEAPQPPASTIAAPDAGGPASSTGNLATSGLHVTALALLALTSLGIGTALVLQRRTVVSSPAVAPEPG